MTSFEIMQKTGFGGGGSPVQTPVYTVSSAGTSVVNGGYFFFSLLIFKHVSESIYMRTASGAGEWHLTSDINSNDSSVATTYYSWVSDDITFPTPVTGGTETIGTAGTAPFPTIADA